MIFNRLVLTFVCFAFLVLAPLPAASAGEKAKPKADEPEIVAKGFKMHFFATPPDVDYPSCVAVSPSGVVFAGQDPYNVRANKSKTGKIKMYVDSDGDGKADKVTTFADNVNGPRGMCYVDGVLYVVAAPTLTAYKDDGSGKAASEDVLVTGYGFEPEKLAPDHSESGVRMAIDGWLYLAVGDQGFLKAKGKDGNEAQLHGGGLCRIRPDGTEFELFCRGTRNNYDVSGDPLLNCFSRDNTNDGRKWNVRFAHLVYGAEYGYPSLFINYADEILPCLADWGDGAGTGSIFIHEPNMPEGFGNTLLTCDWARGRIYWHTLDPDGATFKVKQDVFYKGTRPTDIDVDGRGRIYVSDWRGATYGKEKDPNKPVGFVTMIENEKGASSAPFPDLNKATDTELLADIQNESQVLRVNAQRALLRRPFKQENAVALEAVLNGKASMYARVAALFTYKQMLGTKSHAALAKLLDNAEMKEFALRALADRKSQLDGLDPKIFTTALNDANPRVREQAVIALMRLNKPELASALVPILTDKDVEVAHLAMRALRALKAVDVCLDAAGKGPSETATAALKTMREMHDEKAVQGLSKILAGAKDEAYHTLVLETIARLFNEEMEWDGKWWGIPPDTTGPHFKNAKWAQSGEIAKILTAEFEHDSDALKAAIFKMIARYKIPAADLPGALAHITDPKAKLTPELAHVIVLLGEIKLDTLPQLERIIAEKSFDVKIRAEAIEALGRVSVDAKNKSQVADKTNAIARALDPLSAAKDTPKELFAGAARLLNAINAKDLNAATLGKWTTASSGEFREAVFAQLLKKKDEPAAKAAIESAWKDAPSTESLLIVIEKTKPQEFAEKVRPFISDKSGSLRRAAIIAAGSLGDSGSIEPLLERAEKNDYTGETLTALNKLKTDKLPADRLSALAERVVKLAEANSSSKDENIVSGARSLAQKFCDDKRLKPETVASFKERLAKIGADEPIVGEFEPSDAKYSATTDPRYKDLMQKMLVEHGDKEKGKELFTSLGCIKCHTLSPKDPPKGPYLGEVGSKYKRPDLIESIVLPSEKLAMGYEPKLITVDGELLSGFITNETGDKFEFHMADGTFKVIEKKNVEKKRDLKLSIMPNGLVAKLTIKQFAHLLSYLESLQKSE